NNTVVIGGNRPVVVSASPSSVKPSQALTVTWSGIQNPTPTDWVALIAIGAPDSAIRAWRYTTGSNSGSVPLTVPWGTPPGSYEVRLFYNNSTVRLGSSNVVTVS
ncbi:MAG: hypothetical protein M3144_04950, partial [Actinomycetota bacterium]|nr:hypothetical protein [Actinomycetota bacterium]